MLTNISDQKSGRIENSAVAVVAARYNHEYVDALVNAAVAELKPAVDRVEVVRVPGSFEIPAVAARLTRANDPEFEAIICLGVIFQGETTHAQNISDAVSHALAELQIISGKPVIHGVLLFDNREQAQFRCYGKDHNRGIETARTALEMIRVMRTLQNYERVPLA